jgi:hypothetical protein
MSATRASPYFTTSKPSPVTLRKGESGVGEGGGVGVEGKKEFSGYGKVQHQTRMGGDGRCFGCQKLRSQLGEARFEPAHVTLSGLVLLRARHLQLDFFDSFAYSHFGLGLLQKRQDL